ncbi:metal-dependent hydrolase [Leptolyngbya sp. FACHB-17]|uniref:metal-dependent hydrolase n=1 Tax=unclassified Leptolyngbya TaxID=2650499 RepID=UPI001680FE60|nr:metal-dependent hydrolase [Leptolyngbya sp. FACHB-17]MBD2079733.1 metal-dependent hydrolase [Leptolyngbya sp. FACHB-17]
MLSVTHAAIATAGTSLILGTADPLALLLSLIGTQLPDLGTSTSYIGQIFFPISRWLEARFPHRTITHSLLATGFLCAIALPIGYFTNNLLIWSALPLGHLLTCIADCFTVKGVQWFYPIPAWCWSVSNPKRRITTGKPGEYWVLVTEIALLVVGLHLGSSGELTQQITTALGITDGAVEVYNKKSLTHHVWADIKGIWSADRTRADGKYFVVANGGDPFIVTDRKGGFFKTGQQILTERIAATIGNPATTQLLTVSFTDEEIAPKLQEIAASQPKALILLSSRS